MNIYHVVMPNQKAYYLFEYSTDRVYQYTPEAISVIKVDNTLANIKIPHLSNYYYEIDNKVVQDG